MEKRSLRRGKSKEKGRLWKRGNNETEKTIDKRDLWNGEGKGRKIVGKRVLVEKGRKQNVKIWKKRKNTEKATV